MKKFWRSGMIDKKVLREREREEYINKLEMSNLFLKKEWDEGCYAVDIETYNNIAIIYKKEKPKPDYRVVSGKEWKEMRAWAKEQMKNHPRYDTFKGVEL